MFVSGSTSVDPKTWLDRSRASQPHDSRRPHCARRVNSDIPVTETQTDAEMIDISKTHTETNTAKIFSTDTYRNDRVKN